jgi:hypothetical protein
MALPILGALTLDAICRRPTTMCGIVVGIRLGWGVVLSTILILIANFSLKRLAWANATPWEGVGAGDTEESPPVAITRVRQWWRTPRSPDISVWKSENRTFTHAPLKVCEPPPPPSHMHGQGFDNDLRLSIGHINVWRGRLDHI